MKQPLRAVFYAAIVLAQATVAATVAASGDDALPLDLTATGWELVEVRSMDGGRFAPAASGSGRYTLSFLEEGKVVIQADCNRATTTIEPLLPPRLKFTQIAVTGALCSPSSIADRFLNQLPWIRRYVTRDGKLFLATVADGSILEFAPLPPEPPE